MTDADVRPAEPADAEAIRRIAREAWHAAYDEFLGAETVEERIEAWYDPADLRESAAAPEEAFYVAERERILGFVHLVPDGDEPGLFHLARIYVRPGEWGEGVGTALLEAGVEAVRAAGGERIRLAVFAANEVGVAFYESRGFERVETRESGLGEGVEEYVYERAP